VIAAWYDRQGVNPGDTKKRGNWVGAGMPFARIVPHSDGAGVVEAVGEGVDRIRIGQRVWVYGAQSCRACGTAAQFTVPRPRGRMMALLPAAACARWNRCVRSASSS